MRPAELSPIRPLRALELFEQQACPHNFGERATFVDHRSIHTRHARRRHVREGLYARSVAGGERGS